jgi:CMP-N,N'-diacetyllegionaminic acid synthase
VTEILAVIPARTGSKSVPDKNVRLLAGKPMVVYSIEQSLASPSITRAVVSTDSETYATIARGAGADVPFIRPAKLAEDLSTDLEVFQHALDWLDREEGYVPDIVVHLRPTHPVRTVVEIEEMISMLCEHEELDSVRSVTPEPRTSLKTWFRDDNGLLHPAGVSELREPYNLPRQALPPVFRQNGSIDVVRASVIKAGSMTGSGIFGYVMEHDFDIDTWDDLTRVSVAIEARGLNGSSMTVCLDIDGVLATIVPENDYELAEPILPAIRLVNEIAARGHRVVLQTARGSKTGLDWRETTLRQLAEWGVHYDEMRFGKPAADFYVDDRMITMELLSSMLSLPLEPSGGEPA